MKREKSSVVSALLPDSLRGKLDAYVATRWSTRSTVIRNLLEEAMERLEIELRSRSNPANSISEDEGHITA